MNKKLFWTRPTSIFLITALSLLSACSDAEENVSKNKIEATPSIQEQVATADQTKDTEIVLKDVTGLYKELPTAQPTRTGDRIEVLEVFWYGCPHCYHFEPVIEKWLDEKSDYIEFVRMPGILGKNWLPHARAFYAAEKIPFLIANF
jgi:thiol-disulfide isomerase/thioredoxin